MARNNPTITWTVTIDQANQMLSVLADRKFNEVADLIVDLRTQAAGQMQAMQQTMDPPPTGMQLPLGAKSNGPAEARE